MELWKSVDDNRSEVWAGWSDFISNSTKLWDEMGEHTGPVPTN